MLHRRVVLALILGLGGVRAWGLAFDPQGKKLPKIAIVGTAEASSLTETTSGALEALTESALHRTGVVGVVSRNDLPAQFREIKLSEQGLVSEKDRKALGKLQVADYLLTIQPIGLEVSEKTMDSTDFLTGRPKQITQRSAKGTLVFRFTQVETGVVLAATTTFGSGGSIDKVLRECFKQLEEALVRGAKGARSSTGPVPIRFIREDYIRVPLGSDGGLTPDSVLQVVEEVKDGEYTDYKVIGAARPREIFADNAKLEVGKLGRKNRFQRDDKLLKTLKIPGTLVRFAPLGGESKPSGKNGVTLSLDLWSGLK